jgi:hypothetical protein
VHTVEKRDNVPADGDDVSVISRRDAMEDDMQEDEVYIELDKELGQTESRDVWSYQFSIGEIDDF